MCHKGLSIGNRLGAYREILWASGLEGHSYSQADAAFEAFLRHGGERPPIWRGGELDWLSEVTGMPLCCPFEGFAILARGCKEWPDLIDALKIMRRVPSFEGLRLPDEILATIEGELYYWREVEKALFDPCESNKPVSVVSVVGRLRDAATVERQREAGRKAADTRRARKLERMAG